MKKEFWKLSGFLHQKVNMQLLYSDILSLHSEILEDWNQRNVTVGKDLYDQQVEPLT